MAQHIGPDQRLLRIIHVLRAPLGGLYRHVLDLSREQARRGHMVGLIVDSTTGGEAADRTLADLQPRLALGLSRVPMRRDPHPSDIAVLAHVARRIGREKPDIVHGHGSKGGLYARLPGFMPGARAVRAYTPHGGSLNHRPGSMVHGAYMRVEGLLARRTDMLLFESAFIGSRYRELVSQPARMARVVHNGIAEDEFTPVVPAPGAADFLYVGELRAAKGIDILLKALRAASLTSGTALRAVLVGSGPDREALERLVSELGLDGQVTFTGPMPARQAFTLGRVLVVPSRAESLPYVVLEAAAGRLPMIATDVGGIPEIFGPYADRLIPCNDVERLVASMLEIIGVADATRTADAAALAAFVHSGFSIGSMVDSVVAAYRDAIAVQGHSTPSRAPAFALPS